MIGPRAAGGFLVLLIALAATPATYAQSPVVFSFKTYPDTLGTGVSNHKIEFYVDGNGHEIATLIFGFELQFADSNLFGPIPFVQKRVRDASGAFRFELQEWGDAYGTGSNPDTVLFVFRDTNGVYFQFDDPQPIWSLYPFALAPGILTLDTISGLGTPPTVRAIGAMDSDSNWLPVQWEGGGDTMIVVTTPPVLFDIQTSTGTDTLTLGALTRFTFNVDANGHDLAALVFPFRATYSGSNVLGALAPSDFTFSEASDVFEQTPFNLTKWDGQGDDSLLLACLDGGGGGWLDSGAVWSFETTVDTVGSFHFDTILIPPANVWAAINQEISSLPIEIINYGREYVVIIRNGDVNADAVITASDIIYLVNFAFKSGPVPRPCQAVGDSDCNGEVSAADIIMLVSYIFKSGTSPCDIMALIPATWTCP